MADLPRGNVTFLFTDIEGSTALWEEAPDSIMEALRLHDDVIDSATDAHNGVSVKPRGEGDSRFVVFSSAIDALAAIAEIQQAFASVEWPTPRPIRVRAALHTGEAELQLGDYYGAAVNRAARLRAVAHGGQSVMSESTWQLVRDAVPEGISLRDMGEHRLKDLARPERVYQIDPAGLPTEFPELDSLDAVRTNLPVQMTDFVGRARELAEVKEALGRSRLVTILAPGGAGKTRLAIQAAADLAGRFPDGVFFADLSPIDVIGDVPQVVADAIGVVLGGDGDQETQLLAHLAGKRLLVVVDNAEHIPEVADLIAAVLSRSDTIKVLATSRNKLNVSGEAVYRLTGLDHRWDSAEAALESSGVRLFIDAARRADTGWELAPGDLEPLGRILDLVGGLPLGILLAASWADTLTVAEIADEVARSMDFLESESRDAPERHRSLRAVFEYSWALLDENEQRTLAALSVFRGGFTRESARAVTGADLRALTRLESKSLLALDREAGRYSIHELVREYAGEELATDERRAHSARGDHARHFADIAENAMSGFVTAQNQSRALGLIDADYLNLRSALRWAATERDASVALRVVSPLQFLMEIRGSFQAAFDLLDEVAEAFGPDTVDADERAVAALVRVLRARVAMNLGMSGEVVESAERWTAVLGELPDRLAYGVALEAMCELSVFAGDPERVLEWTEEAVALADEQGLEMWVAAMRNYEGLALMLLDRSDEALAALRAGDEVLSRMGEAYMRSWNLETQALLALGAGRLDETIEIRRRALALARSVGYSRVVALSSHGIGSALVQKGDLEAARVHLDRALADLDRMGMVVEKALVLLDYASLLEGLGEHARAVELLAAVETHRTAANPHPMQGGLVGDLAGQGLRRLERSMRPHEFSEAREKGALKGFDVVVKELVAAA